MRVLFARLDSSEWKNRCFYLPSQSLDLYELASALRETPVLGLGIQHLHLDQQHGGSWHCSDHSASQKASDGRVYPSGNHDFPWHGESAAFTSFVRVFIPDKRTLFSSPWTPRLAHAIHHQDRL